MNETLGVHTRFTAFEARLIIVCCLALGVIAVSVWALVPEIFSYSAPVSLSLRSASFLQQGQQRRTIHHPRFRDVLLHRLPDLLHAEGQGGHPNEVPEEVRRRVASQDGKVISVAVYRVNKNRGYTVMANFHLRDKSLSHKAVGLLSKMLSFNDGWKFSTKGLSAICKEGLDAILSALRELEKHGYLVRHRRRDGKGRMSSTIFEIYEEPQESTPEREMPHTGNPCVEKPDVDNPHGDKSAQINTDQVITSRHGHLDVLQVVFQGGCGDLPRDAYV